MPEHLPLERCVFIFNVEFQLELQRRALNSPDRVRGFIQFVRRSFLFTRAERHVRVESLVSRRARILASCLVSASSHQWSFDRDLSSARGFGLWRRAIVLVPLTLAALSFGCGSSSQDIPGTAKEKKEEERYRYEGTGAAKQKVLIRRKDERQKELSEKAKHSSEATKN